MTIPPQRQAAIRSIQLRQMYRSCVSFNASKMTHLRTPHGKNAWLSIIVGDSDTTQNNHAMTSLREIRIVISHYPVLVAYDGRTTIFDPIVDLVNAVAKVQGSYGSHGATTVVVDFPVFVDKDHPKMAEVLEKAPFLKFRTPRTAAQIPLDGTGRKRHMWYL
ncbi:hypothetical protein FQN54_000039 [Arachnomyces sp. PD_36]|nr:hypothetical protein FQN54_000039 [Arachnomyces sp. PD_36]